MKIDLESGRRAESDLLEERSNRYMESINLDVRPEQVRCSAKDFFKTMASLHLVTISEDGHKAMCSCCGYYQNLICEHVALADMIGDISFEIPQKYVEKSAKFRRRIGRRKGGQKQDDIPSTKGWDVMICGDMESSDESETTFRNIRKSFKNREVSVTGCEPSSVAEAM